MQPHIILFFVFAIFTAMLHPLRVFAEEPIIRVEVLDKLPSVNISAFDGDSLTIQDTNKELWSGKFVTFSAISNGLKINGKYYTGTEFIITSKLSSYKIAEKIFSGTLRVIMENNHIIVVDDIPLETYITGLINSEISSKWPDESIKAQAVAARTYALNQMERVRKARPNASYDIESTIMDQVYAGAHREDARSREVVAATRGQVLTRNGAVFPAFYHSCCGGLTERAENVWSDAQGPAPVEDHFCEWSPKRNWLLIIPRAELQKKLSMGNLISIICVPLLDSPRVNTVIFETTTGLQNIKATELRRILGYTDLKSTWFEIKMDGNKIVFTGRGYGHGVGMCQWGAKGMADMGHTYTDILKFYYPDAEITSVY